MSRGTKTRLGETEKRTHDEQDRSRKRDENSDRGQGDGVKRYKPRNAESIVVSCQAWRGSNWGWNPCSVRTHFIAITANTCGSQGRGRRGDCVSQSERGREGKKLSINLLEIWPEFTARLLVNIRCAAVFSLDTVFKAPIWFWLTDTSWLALFMHWFIGLKILPLYILPDVYLALNYLVFQSHVNLGKLVFSVC